MADTGPTSLMPGDICIVCTTSKLLHVYMFLKDNEWFSIDHVPVAWTGNWAMRVASLIESWASLPRTLRIFRACNEAITVLADATNDNPELAEDAALVKAVTTYKRIKKEATSRTGSLTLPLVQRTVESLIVKLTRQANTDRDTVVNLLGTIIEDISHNEALRTRKITELRIEGLDQLTNAIMMIFGAGVRQGSAVTMLQQALEAVQENARTLENWLPRTDDVTAQAWNQIAQRPADRERQLNRFNLRNRKNQDADGSRVQTDHS
jgi:hypothetical protein